MIGTPEALASVVQARRRILGISFVGALVSLLFAWMVPFGANPDETAHRDHIRLMSEQRGLVVFVPPAGRQPLPDPVLARIEKAAGMRVLPEGAPSRDEAHQPPLYYLVASLLWGVVGDNTALLRSLSVLFQWATIQTVGLGLLALFGKRPGVAVAAAAITAFWPVQAQLGGAISNDPLCHFLCAILLLAATRWTVQGVGRKEAAIVGIVLGMGLLTKTTVLQLVPLVVAAVGDAVVRRKTRPIDAALCLSLVIGIGVLIASPWYWRNLQLYGDPLARSIYVATGPNFVPAAIQQMAGWAPAEYYRQVGVRTVATVWYFLDPNLPFRWFSGPVGPLAVVLVMVFGGGVGLWRRFSNRSAADADERVALGFLAVAPWGLLPFYVVFVSTVFQAQGRYFLPALVGIAASLAIGWSSILPKRRDFGAMVPAIVLGVLCLIQWTGAGFVPNGDVRSGSASRG